MFSEQPSSERQNIYFIFEYVEQDLERYLKMNNPIDIDQIRVFIHLFVSLENKRSTISLFRILLDNY